jgi:type IV pilus assembly protein PilV
VTNPERYDQVDQIRVLIMVRFPAPGGGMRQVNTWAIRYNVALITGDAQTSQEL